MAITIITDPVSLSVDENTSSRNYIDLGSLVLTDPRRAGFQVEPKLYSIVFKVVMIRMVKVLQLMGAISSIILS